MAEATSVGAPTFLATMVSLLCVAYGIGFTRRGESRALIVVGFGVLLAVVTAALSGEPGVILLVAGTNVAFEGGRRSQLGERAAPLALLFIGLSIGFAGAFWMAY